MIDKNEVPGITFYDCDLLLPEEIMIRRKKKYFKPVKGLVYLIQLSRDRYKMGFTAQADEAEARVKSARTWVPEAELIATWPAISTWELPARHFVVGQCELEVKGGSEVFQDATAKRTKTNRKGEILNQVDQFFQRMPSVDSIEEPYALGAETAINDGDTDGQVIPIQREEENVE